MMYSSQNSSLQIFTALLSYSAIFSPFAMSAAATCTTSNFSQDPGTVKSHTICVGGNIERTYLLSLPNNYESEKTSRPLILSYHGGTRDAQRQLNLDQFTNPKYNKDAIVAYPQGINVYSPLAKYSQISNSNPGNMARCSWLARGRRQIHQRASRSIAC